MRMIVLGAGPVGLVSAFSLRASLCIGTFPGGGRRDLAPFYLWRSPGSERLLRELDLPRIPVSRRFGWLTARGFTTTPSPEAREAYYERSRGVYATPPASVGSSGKAGVLDVWDVDADDLVGRLLRRVLVLTGTVEHVRSIRSQVEVSLSGSGSVRSDCVVNSLPAPTWDRLRRRSNLYQYGIRKYFSESRLGDLPPSLRRARIDGVSYVYVTDPDLPYDRVTFRGRRAILEFNVLPPTGFSNVIPGPDQVVGVSVPSVEELGGKVLHVGRYARWNHSIRLHNVADECYQRADTLTEVSTRAA